MRLLIICVVAAVQLMGTYAYWKVYRQVRQNNSGKENTEVRMKNRIQIPPNMDIITRWDKHRGRKIPTAIVNKEEDINSIEIIDSVRG